MDLRNKVLWLLMMVLFTTFSDAVEVNHKGLGEVLIYPYYTVNNDLNTFYSVVNTTADTKAVSVRFLEGDNGLEVLTFNVYLAAFDVWTGGLTSGFSTVAGHEGEPSVIHLTTDTSCAPFLVKSGQEFLPFVIDMDLDENNISLNRAREGYIEITEMATFVGGTIPAADHTVVGTPTACNRIQADWADDGIYNTLNDESVPSGGLIGSASLVNVLEGLAFSYDAIALQNFWQGEGLHSEPGSLEPNLSSAFPESKVLLDSGEWVTSEWEHGFQAVSAVLTQFQIMNEYAIDSIVAGKTEWVMTFPTKRFHSNSTNEELLAPFTQQWDGSGACEMVAVDVWDRESNELSRINSSVDPEPQPRPIPNMCYVSNVIEFAPTGVLGNSSSSILGADDYFTLNTSSFGSPIAATESGWGRMEFMDSVVPSPSTGAGFKGLPVIGFAVQQYTNTGAAEGLLAQYGALFKHKALIEVDAE